MFTNNPFATLTEILPALFMQVYIVLMILAVIAGTLFDVYHKGSAKFFAQRREKSEARAQRPLSGGEKFALALETIAEAAVSGEFCKLPWRGARDGRGCRKRCRLSDRFHFPVGIGLIG